MLCEPMCFGNTAFFFKWGIIKRFGLKDHGIESLWMARCMGGEQASFFFLTR